MTGYITELINNCLTCGCIVMLKVRNRSYSGPYLSVFSPNAGKSGKNADQNNSEYGFLLRRVYLHENRTKNLSRTCIPVFWIYALMFLKDQHFSRKNNWYVTFLKANNLTYSRANFMFLVKFLAGCRLEVGQFCLHGPENETQKSHWQ